MLEEYSCAVSSTDIERGIQSVSYRDVDSVILQTIKGKIVQDTD